MSRNKRVWSKEFIEYMEYIAKHPNYDGLPEKYKEDGSVRWVVAGNSVLGKKRGEWWDKKVEQFHTSNKAEVARLIHPKELNGMKPCQTCGKELSIFYVYPSKTTLNQLNKVSNLEFESYDLTISEIFEILFEEIGVEVYSSFKKIFKIPDDIKNSKEDILDYIHSHPGRKLSPGVMSNAPDRFDGFHTYNACCRSKEDTGRHKENLARYSQDRRAYENWAEGDWNLSNRLMGEFNKYSKQVPCPNCNNKAKMSADHIGPISLGFTHRPKFNPLCSSCNSGKNNRMSLNDVLILIEDERNGEKVVSWHTKYLWDALKENVKTDDDALKLSKIMREHLHKVLCLLAIISTVDKNFLKDNFLNPEYSFYDYTFKNFDPLNLDKLEIIKKSLDSKNKKKNAERYIRISFESLDQYIFKDNRKLKDLDEKYSHSIEMLKNKLNSENYSEALKILNDIIKQISDEEIKKF